MRGKKKPPSASLLKATVVLLGGRGKLPQREELAGYAEAIFRSLCRTVSNDGGGDTLISSKDLYVWLNQRAEVGAQLGG